MLVDSWNAKAKRLEVLGDLLRTKDVKEEQRTEALKLQVLLRDINSMTPIIDEAKLLVSRVEAGAMSALFGSGAKVKVKFCSFTSVPALAERQRRDVAASRIQTAWRGQRRAWCSIPARRHLMQPQVPAPRARPAAAVAETPARTEEVSVASPSRHRTGTHQVHHRRASARFRASQAVDKSSPEGHGDTAAAAVAIAPTGAASSVVDASRAAVARAAVASAMPIMAAAGAAAGPVAGPPRDHEAAVPAAGGAGSSFLSVL